MSSIARASFLNLQNEMKVLLESHEALERENSELKIRLLQKNETLLLRMTKALPSTLTDQFLHGLKTQNLHFNDVGDIAISQHINQQFGSTYQNYTDESQRSLKSQIYIQKEKLKTASAKIAELNDFIKQQDSLLNQTKELLKTKCAQLSQFQTLSTISSFSHYKQQDKFFFSELNQSQKEDEFYYGMNNSQNNTIKMESSFNSLSGKSSSKVLKASKIILDCQNQKYQISPRCRQDQKINNQFISKQIDQELPLSSRFARGTKNAIALIGEMNNYQCGENYFQQQNDNQNNQSLEQPDRKCLGILKMSYFNSNCFDSNNSDAIHTLSSDSRTNKSSISHLRQFKNNISQEQDDAQKSNRSFITNNYNSSQTGQSDLKMIYPQMKCGNELEAEYIQIEKCMQDDNNHNENIKKIVKGTFEQNSFAINRQPKNRQNNIMKHQISQLSNSCNFQKNIDSENNIDYPKQQSSPKQSQLLQIAHSKTISNNGQTFQENLPYFRSNKLINNELFQSQSFQEPPQNIHNASAPFSSFSSISKTENSSIKRHYSNSNQKRRSRAQRIHKSNNSIKLTQSTSIDYNTFNPLL